MKRFLDRVKKYINGESRITQQEKLEFISIAVTIVHLILVAMFAAVNVWPLIFYNIIVVVYYVYAFRQVSEGHILKGYVLTFLEIGLQSLVATFVVGSTAGFCFYLFAIIPVFFYINITYDTEGKRIMQPVIATLVVGLLMVANILLHMLHQPLFVMTDKQTAAFLIYNSFLSVILIGVMSHFFILESRDSLKALTAKNMDLDQQASEDPLTGLSNRRSMEIVLENALTRAKERGVIFSLIMGDIDNFKKINDTYGHDGGDEALVAVARIFEGSIRDGDCVCRWGGEEFLILITGNSTEATAAAERIRKKIEDNVVMYEGQEIRFTMTFGVTTYVPGYNLETLIGQADDNLYTGKNSGKNCVITTKR